MVVVRKNITKEKGELRLHDEVRYFFYITNDWVAEADALVFCANDRCHQENLLAQLHGGCRALQAPVDNLESNWAYMVMTALAWNLKAWFGLLLPNRAKGLALVGMEFRRFLHALILLPAQIVRSGRKIIYRILSYNSWVKDLFAFWERMRRLAVP